MRLPRSLSGSSGRGREAHHRAVSADAANSSSNPNNPGNPMFKGGRNISNSSNTSLSPPSAGSLSSSWTRSGVKQTQQQYNGPNNPNNNSTNTGGVGISSSHEHTQQSLSSSPSAALTKSQSRQTQSDFITEERERDTIRNPATIASTGSQDNEMNDHGDQSVLIPSVTTSGTDFSRKSLISNQEALSESEEPSRISLRVMAESGVELSSVQSSVFTESARARRDVVETVALSYEPPEQSSFIMDYLDQPGDRRIIGRRRNVTVAFNNNNNNNSYNSNHHHRDLNSYRDRSSSINNNSNHTHGRHDTIDDLDDLFGSISTTTTTTATSVPVGTTSESQAGGSVTGLAGDSSYSMTSTTTESEDPDAVTENCNNNISQFRSSFEPDALFPGPS